MALQKSDFAITGFSEKRNGRFVSGSDVAPNFMNAPLPEMRFKKFKNHACDPLSPICGVNPDPIEPKHSCLHIPPRKSYNSSALLCRKENICFQAQATLHHAVQKLFSFPSSCIFGIVGAAQNNFSRKPAVFTDINGLQEFNANHIGR